MSHKVWNKKNLFEFKLLYIFKKRIKYYSVNLKTFLENGIYTEKKIKFPWGFKASFSLDIINFKVNNHQIFYIRFTCFFYINYFGSYIILSESYMIY